MIYLDNAATTLQKPPAVAKAVSNAISHMASPGRGGHQPALRAAQTVFACREAAATLFDVPEPEQVVFTSSATHSLNIAIHALVKPGDTVLISGYEHNAVTRPLHAIRDIKIKVAGFPLFDRDAALRSFRSQLTEEVTAVITTHVSNVFGCVLPISEIAELCRAKGVPLIIDAAQSAGCLPLSLRQLGAAFIAMPGHKGLYGPQGTGLLLCNAPVEPLLSGGTGSDSINQNMPFYLPDRLEAGTHNVPGIAGLLEGIRFVHRVGTKRIATHEWRLLQKLGDGLSSLPEVTAFIGEDPADQTGAMSFQIRGWDCETIGEMLAARGIAVRAGLHCAPLAHQSGGTLENGTIRVSVSAFTNTEMIRNFIHELKSILA